MANTERNVLLEITANRPSCVDQERASLGKRIVSIVTQFNGLDPLNINDLPIPSSTYLDIPRHTSTHLDTKGVEC